MLLLPPPARIGTAATRLVGNRYRIGGWLIYLDGLPL